jgi:hypothetical protein
VNFTFRGARCRQDATFFQNGPSHDGWQPPKMLAARTSASQPKGYSGAAKKDG